jgi:2,3-bisphosphoglycerate-independent phosphoglycerate mutase
MTLPRPSGPVVLCILDGVGLGEGGEDDAVATARTPHLDALYARWGMRPLRAHGRAVGLPSDADMGNSEVGHNAMGAGRVIDQGASLVQQAIASGAMWTSDAWRWLCAAPSGTLHLLGMVSDGNVHSHVDHLLALLDAAGRSGLRRVRVHLLTDGRDVAPRSALTYLPRVEDALAKLRAAGLDAQIASGGGRMAITMDRYEADWAMVERGWRCHVHGEGRPFRTAAEAIQTLYAEDPAVDDQWLAPFVLVDEAGQPVGRVVDGDAVLLFHFRGDRAIEISAAFERDAFTAFDRGARPHVRFAGMMQYDGDLHLPARFLVPPPAIDDTVGHRLAAAGLRTLAVAETQKFGHVTYFFNGNRSGYVDPALERYVEVRSDVRPFEQAPWMKAAEVTDAALAAIAEGGWDHIRINFANGDMVGHSGDLEATRVAVEAVDLQLGRLVPAILAAGGVLLLTADHGNADEMWQRGKGGAVAYDAEGAPLPRTSHTLHPVPCVLADPRGLARLRDDRPQAGITSIGPTLLALLGLDVPDGWDPSLLAPG